MLFVEFNGGQCRERNKERETESAGERVSQFKYGTTEGKPWIRF